MSLIDQKYKILFMEENEKLKLEYSEFASKFGKQYMSSGGPTARLENTLTQLAKDLNLKADVFATPTGVFVNTMVKMSAIPMTSLKRIKSKSINLEHVVRLENLISDISTKKVSLTQAISLIKLSPKKLKPQIYYPAVFFAGFSCSFPQYESFVAAFFSGSLAIMVAWLSGPFAKKYEMSQIFTDFLGCFFALIFSGGLSIYLSQPLPGFAIGALVYLVPGLTLTMAITELAEQNFVSGTAEMMKGILVLLAMGTAYLLAKDLIIFFNPDFITQIIYQNQNKFYFWPKFLGNIAIAFAFSITYRVPKPMIILSICVATISWGILQLFQNSHFFILGTFLPAFSVGTLSLLFGKILKVPSQVFSVPGIFSLLPGLVVFSTFYNVSGGNSGELSSLSQGMLVATSITFGLLSARLPFQMLSQSKKS